ncbi:MAG TPA: cation-translocating P-type ATPase [Candidatus Nanoarchaeia archaeon]|nr:cation-translocating P-type ATPase [Candidatus Nanoarchaeia archaeon]
MEFYQRSVESVLSELGSSQEGLSSKEAKRRLSEYGENVLKKTKRISALRLLLRQFQSFIVMVLVAAGAVSYLVGERLDGLVIGAIVLLNAILGFIQEFKAERAIEALRKLSAPKARVIREGKNCEIDAKEVVPGDVLVIEEGSFISADARLISIASLSIDESSLTGESVPVSKVITPLAGKTEIGSRRDMVFAGTVAARGRGQAVVVSTGLKTELGKIAEKLQEIQHETTPLQKQLKYLGNYLTLSIFVVCGIIFGISWWRTSLVLDSFINAVALAVAAVPEGLPAVITITLALGTRRMLRRKALIRRLHAVETLGATSVICADKTGTMTKNEMAVLQLYVDRMLVDVGKGMFSHEGVGLDPKKFSKLFEIGVACNNASLDGPADPTERALLVVAEKAKVKVDVERLKEIPFSSEKKFMATVDKTGIGEVTHVKGAPEIVVEMCDAALVHGKVVPLTRKERENLLSAASAMAGNALRVLGFGYAPKGKKLIFVGFMGMLDPPREGMVEAVALCKRAGIRVVMITGDHLLTAQAVASQVGIVGKAMTGDDLDRLPEEKFKATCRDVAVYARVSPQHKLKILSCLQDRGLVVAMTGDGVNDALALKKANIGVATGSGTDVAKEASDMVLLDDNFVSVVNAVYEGRGIYNNLRKFVHYLLSCNLGEVLTIFVGLLLGWPIPLVALQILWVNLLTDGFPALALGVDPVEKDVMTKPPRSARERIVERKDSVVIAIQGALVMFVTLGLYWLYLRRGDVAFAQTVAFSTLVLCQMGVALNYSLGENSLVSGRLFKNKWLWLAIAFSVVLQMIVVYGLNGMFGTRPLGLGDWLVIVGGVIPILIVHELGKRTYFKGVS